MHFLSVENDSSDSEYVKYVQSAIIEKLLNEVEVINGYVYIYIFFKRKNIYTEIKYNC